MVAPIAFADGVLDRASHLRDEADGLRARTTSCAVLVGAEQEVAVTPNGTLALAPVADLPPDAALTFLGLDAAGAAVFAHDAANARTPTPARAQFTSLRGLMAELDPAEAALAAYAVGMVGWHRVNRYCGRSGHATEVEAAGHRRRCPGCGLLHFPRTDPAITMLVQSEDKALLSRRHGAPHNRWSALAGFVEPGETPEQAVVREAREETGVSITSVEYVTSQPWPFPAALMIGFWAFTDPADDAAPEPTPEPGELLDVRWWERSELADAISKDGVGLPPPGTIGNYLIATWLGNYS